MSTQKNMLYFECPKELLEPFINPCDIMEPDFLEFIESCIESVDTSCEAIQYFKFEIIPPKSQEKYYGPWSYRYYVKDYMDNIVQFLTFTARYKFGGEREKYMHMLVKNVDGSYSVTLILHKPSC